MISIIIPIYNGVQHIDKCVDSLLIQKDTNFEAIFINDGSTDSTPDIVQKYCDEDSRFTLVNKKNEGVAIAREVGVEHAKGDYITFMDIDDTIESDMISFFNQQILNNNAIDIFVSGYNIIYSDKTEFVSFEKSTINSDQFLRFILTHGRWALWAKIYKKSLFNNISTPSDIKIGEDAIVFIQLILAAKKISVSDLNFYNYIQHETSASYHQSKEMASEGIRAASVINKLLQDSGYKDVLCVEIETMYLLFFSNSLRRGYIEDLDLLNDVKGYVSFGALKRLGFLKSVYILLNMYGGMRVHTLFLKIFNKFYKS